LGLEPHLTLGGALGAIISKDRLKGALIGGLSAGGAEIVAEALMGDVTAQVIDLKEAGFNDDQSRDHIMKLARFNGEFSKLASAGIAAISNNNVTTALFTASNAIENNFYHTDFFRRDITFGTETIGGPMGGSPQRGNRFAQQNRGATQNRAPEFTGGTISEKGFLDAAQKYLGEGYKSLPNGRYVSKDGLRQVRYGKHEITSKKHHAHFEAYDKPGGKIIENTQVEINTD
jgi:hypothetical protein